VFKPILMGAALAVLVAGAAQAAPGAPAPALAWMIQPTEAGCRAELELEAKSGAVTPITLVSDGVTLSLRFARDGLPERAFLPLRIDQKPYSNLMLRTGEPAVGELVLSPETVTALRSGSTLQVAWLSDQPVGASLSGSDQALTDLLTCGAQAASVHKAKLAAETEARARAEAEARERAITEAKLAAVQAEAERERALQEAERQRELADAERQRLAYEEQRQRREEQAERERAYNDALRRYGYEERPLPAQPQPWRPAYGYRRY